MYFFLYFSSYSSFFFCVCCWNYATLCIPARYQKKSWLFYWMPLYVEVYTTAGALLIESGSPLFPRRSGDNFLGTQDERVPRFALAK